MADLVVKDLVKRYGGYTAIEDVSFRVAEGELVTLLGPSGCGKSTTLMAIAGLEHPTSGLIRAGERDLFNSDSGTALLPELRNCGLVFQAYALWPHMTVAQNVGFPLGLRKVPAAERKRKVAEVLALVDMERFAGRYPHELSGGQQQRVALARTLVYEPAILLLDEPLSNLDAKLRERARVWLSQLHKQVRRTTVYVTHDQSEALALSDRIIVMNGGRIVQIGTPQEIYEQPAEAFVADFIGTSSFLTGSLQEVRGDWARVQLDGGVTVLACPNDRLDPGTPVMIALRPERLRLLHSGETAPDEPGTRVPARVEAVSYLGARYQVELQVEGTTVRIDADQRPARNEVEIWIPASSSILFRQSEKQLAAAH